MLNQRWPRDLKNHRGGTNPAWGREEVIREDFPKEVTPALLLELFFPFIKMAFLSSIRSFFFFFSCTEHLFPEILHKPSPILGVESGHSLGSSAFNAGESYR